MVFLVFSNANVLFADWELIWRFYITAKVLPTTKQVKRIHKKELAKVALDKGFKTFVIHIIILEALITKIIIYFSQTALIISDDPMQIATF